MMNRVVFALIAVLCLLSVSSLTGLIHLARADGAPITINTDGSITPSTAPIQRNGDTYILTGNVNVTSDTDGIDIERNNIVLNGAGYTVTGSPNLNGIPLGSMDNVTVGNMTITNFGTGISLGSSNCTLSGNNVTNNYYGIELFSSSNNAIYDNNFINNTYQVECYNSTNVWDNGSTGNYWSDYLTRYPNATETDGVWNTPYVIDSNNTDYYPLTVPYAVIPEFPSFLILPLFLITIMLAVIICKKKAMPYIRL